MTSSEKQSRTDAPLDTLHARQMDKEATAYN